MKILIKIAILTSFFVVGTLSYDTLYSCTLKTITFFSGNKIQFFGKLWNFLGMPEFGILVLSIPILSFLAIKELNINSKTEHIKYWIRYLSLIIFFYFATCYLYLRYLFILINSDKIIFENGRTPLYNVKLYVIVIITISLATISNYAYYKFCKIKR